MPTPTIFTPADKLMVDRSMITVQTLEDRDRLADANTVNGKLVRVNDIDGNGTIEYYTWNAVASEWAVASLGYRYMTREEINTAIAEKTDNGIINIVYSDSVGALVITDNTGERAPLQLTGLVHNPLYIEEDLTLTLPVVGGDDVVITIPRDQKLISIRYDDDYVFSPEKHGPAIVCTVTDGVTESEIAGDASALKNVYVGGTTNEAVVQVDQGTNTITCEVKLSTFPDNALKIDNTGFYVDITGKVDKNIINAGCLLIADGQGGFTQPANGVYLATSGSIADLVEPNKYVVTANLISGAIDAAISAISQTFTLQIQRLEQQISDLSDRVDTFDGQISALNGRVTGVEGDVVEIDEKTTELDQVTANLDQRVTALEQGSGFGTTILDKDGEFIPVMTTDKASSGPDDKILATKSDLLDALEFQEF